ncbi:hypothetical protein Clacol_008507 [Clathrus columnatus]|uniref:3-oxoacyl-[acyl-carrier-protein] reductase n=1 Tax=Clathrus columnatus TaxID=1419009 RepID=A0AAV5AMF5_9AGAM|nr:hypothetical protein Clacol_008507 [Clathrus columnatus]
MSSSDNAVLKGKLALITGSTGGIGKATALALARKGINIAVHFYKAEDTAQTLIKELKSLGVNAAAFQADLSTYDGARALYHSVKTIMGDIDILYCNSGVLGKTIGPRGNIQDLSIEMFEDIWRANIGTHILLTQLVLPYMESKRVAAATGGVIGPHYASSKSAMNGLVHWLANRYAGEGITVNAVAPALVTSGMFSDPNSPLKDKIPVKRFGQPEDISSAIELLVSNSYMTNKILAVDGGMTPSAF